MQHKCIYARVYGPVESGRNSSADVQTVCPLPTDLFRPTAATLRARMVSRPGPAHDEVGNLANREASVTVALAVTAQLIPSHLFQDSGGTRCNHQIEVPLGVLRRIIVVADVSQRVLGVES